MSKPKRVELKNGSVVYRVVCDVGRDPETGKRKQLTRTFDRLKDAKAELDRVGYQRSNGTYVRPSKLTVAELIDAYLKSACFEKQAATKSNYAHALRVPRAVLGDRLAQSVTRADIEALRDHMLSAARKRGGTPGTRLGQRSVRLALGRLSAAFEQACEDGRLPRNPCKYAKLPKQEKPKRDTWSEAEVAAFLGEADRDRLAAAWRMTLYGARRGEVLGLQWDGEVEIGDEKVKAVDLDAKTIASARPGFWWMERS